MINDEFIKQRVAYIKGLKSPNDRQTLLVALFDKKSKTASDEKKLRALVKVEKAELKAQEAKASIAKLLATEKEKQRKARTHELIKSGSLMVLADLVDGNTGLPKMDKGALLGGLLSIGNATPEQRKQWKQVGDALLSKNIGNTSK